MSAHLSPSQIALLLDELYGRAGRGWPPELWHWRLADYLGCYPEVQPVAWNLWHIQLDRPARTPQKLAGHSVAASFRSSPCHTEIRLTSL